jgi:hypothetical protein
MKERSGPETGVRRLAWMHNYHGTKTEVLLDKGDGYCNKIGQFGSKESGVLHLSSPAVTAPEAARSGLLSTGAPTVRSKEVNMTDATMRSTNLYSAA